MSKQPKVMAVIPARGGSKGLPRKNIRMLLGRPLIAHMVDIAHACANLDRVIVSTEDDEIAQVARDCGAEVPFVRPEELSQDDTPWVPVLQHALQAMSELHDYHADAVATLQTTTPTLAGKWIDLCVEAYREGGWDSVVTVCEDTRNYKVWKQDGDGTFIPQFDLARPNRQYVDKGYRENGYVYLSSRDVLLDQDRLTGDRTRVVVMAGDSLDIHDEEDLVIAEALMKWRKEKG